MSKIPIKYNEKDIGIGLLESISRGLYLDPLYLIREYVQNSYDAEPGEIRISFIDNKFTIWDDGCGMNKAKILLAKKIGLSEKPSEQVGFRGIGIWAGLAVSDLIKIETSKKGNNKQYTLLIKAKEIKGELNSRKPLTDVLNKYVELYESSSRENDSFTEVELIISEEYTGEFSDEEKISDFIGQVLPTDFDPDFLYAEQIKENLIKNVPNYKTVQIRYMGKIITKPYINSLDPPLFGIIRDGNEIYAYYWTCITKKRGKIKNENIAGLVYKLKGFAIGNRQTTSPLFNSPHLILWATGEVHITNSKIIPNASRDYLEFNKNTEKFISILKNKLHEDLEKTIRDKSSREIAEDQTKKSIKVFKEIMEIFDDLTTVQKKLKFKEIEDIYTSLNINKKVLVNNSLINESNKTIKEIFSFFKKEGKDSEEIKETKKRIKKVEKEQEEKEIIEDSLEKVLGSPKLNSSAKEMLEIVNDILIHELNERDYYITLDIILKRIIKKYKID